MWEVKGGVHSFMYSLILLLPCSFFFQQAESVPAIVVSRQTTYITEPLLPNGLPDYEKFVLKLYRGKVKSENSAAVLLWQAMLPGRVIPADIEPVSHELGLSTARLENTSFQPLFGEDNEQQILKWL
jgi:hypothetical protein